MQSAEDTSNLMDTDHSASLSASSPPLNSATSSSAANVGGAAGAGAAGVGPAVAQSGRTGEALEYHCRMLEGTDPSSSLENRLAYYSLYLFYLSIKEPTGTKIQINRRTNTLIDLLTLS